MIGDVSFLSKGLGKAIVELLTKEVFSKTKAKRIIVQPEIDNDRSRNTLLGAGYRYNDKNDVFIIKKDYMYMKYQIVKLKDRKDLTLKAAKFFSRKWGISTETYYESIEDSFNNIVPSWYVCLDGDKIIGGLGVIENDFHDRTDLTPNVCAVYVEVKYRKQGIAGAMLNYVCEDMKNCGINTLYLLTDHDGFYERYGWKYYCPVKGDGEDYFSRMYIHEM